MAFRMLQDESREIIMQFALLLRDGFADSDQLLGRVSVAGGKTAGQQKDSSGVFLFYDLKPGPQSLAVTSDADTPYYLPKTVAITAPAPPNWSVFPDTQLANPNLPLGDPAQTPAYKAQRQAATLLPTNAYPFPAGTTLIRGTVLHNQLPLSDTTVQLVGGTDPAYTTGDDGQFVLFIAAQPGLPKQVIVTAKHAGLGDGSVNVTVALGLTASVTIDM